MNPDKVLWSAIAFSTVLYAFIAWTIAPNPEQSFEASARAPITMALYGAALATFVAAKLVRGAMRNSPARVRMVVGLAMNEACAIFGLVAAILQHDWRLYLPAWALALAGFLRYWPSDEVSAPAA
ncbi:MAG TPA: hypothetical protein VEK11_00285 [Thermoanaerobaculia bacterium]|jgi:F0F1-type ATP synthase membrane subunit c/vacuolar-type H+-ATPase subunit K|nr:hypothetical protein [Thermoanaerobaculia bacterium]